MAIISARTARRTRTPRPPRAAPCDADPRLQALGEQRVRERPGLAAHLPQHDDPQEQRQRDPVDRHRQELVLGRVRRRVLQLQRRVAAPGQKMNTTEQTRTINPSQAASSATQAGAGVGRCAGLEGSTGFRGRGSGQDRGSLVEIQIRNPKHENRNNIESTKKTIPKRRPRTPQGPPFRHFYFIVWSLFRISCFGFRISGAAGFTLPAPSRAAIVRPSASPCRCLSAAGIGGSGRRRPGG